VVIGAALIAGLVIKLFVCDLMIVDGPSMQPTLYSGNLVMVFRAAYGLRLPWGQSYLVRWGQPRAGSLVIFKSPTGETAVKRVIWSDDKNFYAEGDNRDESLDSRSYGLVSIQKIYGRVIHAD
jgi:signal peptidase I